jgi:Trk K+ transport system NAD-binding subunit
MATQMSVTIAASAVVLRAGAISEAIHAAIVLVVIFLAMAGPVAFLRLMPTPTDERPRPVLVVGANPLAMRLAQRLQSVAPVIMVDRDPLKVEEATRAGLEVLEADVTDPATVQSILARGPLRALVALTGNDPLSLNAARLAWTTLGTEQVIAVVSEPTIWAEARAEGITAINPELAALDLIESLLRYPGATHLLTAGREDIGLFDVALGNPAFSERRLRDARLPAEILVVAIHRAGHKLIPHGDTRLQEGDLLTVIAPLGLEEWIYRTLGGAPPALPAQR